MVPGSSVFAVGWARRRMPYIQTSNETTHRIVSAIMKVNPFSVCENNFATQVPYNNGYFSCASGIEKTNKSKTLPVSNLIAQ